MSIVDTTAADQVNSDKNEVSPAPASPIKKESKDDSGPRTPPGRMSGEGPASPLALLSVGFFLVWLDFPASHTCLAIQFSLQTLIVASPFPKTAPNKNPLSTSLSFFLKCPHSPATHTNLCRSSFMLQIPGQPLSRIRCSLQPTESAKRCQKRRSTPTRLRTRSAGGAGKCGRQLNSLKKMKEHI